MCKFFVVVNAELLHPLTSLQNLSSFLTLQQCNISCGGLNNYRNTLLLSLLCFDRLELVASEICTQGALLV